MVGKDTSLERKALGSVREKRVRAKGRRCKRGKTGEIVRVKRCTQSRQGASSETPEKGEKTDKGKATGSQVSKATGENDTYHKPPR